jgi:hypothetical protein
MKDHPFKLPAAIILLAQLLFFTACSKNDDTSAGPAPLNYATISFSSPTPDSLYTGNVPISGGITALFPIQGYKIILRRKADSTEVLNKEFLEKDTLIAFNEIWLNNVTTQTEMEAEVIAALNSSGATTSEKISFKAAP